MRPSRWARPRPTYPAPITPTRSSSPAAARRRTRVHVVTRRSLRREYLGPMNREGPRPMTDVAAIVLAAGSREPASAGTSSSPRAGRGAPRRSVGPHCLARLRRPSSSSYRPGSSWDGDGIGVVGGATRAESVRNGLARVPASADVRHRARRCASARDARRSRNALVRAVRDGADGAVPVLATRETVAYTDGDALGAVSAARRARARADAARVPHVRPARAHATSRDGATDDASLFQELGHRVVTVDGDPRTSMSRRRLSWS